MLTYIRLIFRFLAGHLTVIHAQPSLTRYKITSKTQLKKRQVRVGITWRFVTLQPTRAPVSVKRRD